MTPSTPLWNQHAPLEENLRQEILLFAPIQPPSAVFAPSRPSNDKSPNHERCSHPARAPQMRQLLEARHTLVAQRRRAIFPWPRVAANGAKPHPVVPHGYKRRQLNKVLGFLSHLEQKLKAMRLHNGENLKPQGCTTKPKGYTHREQNGKNPTTKLKTTQIM